MLQSQPLKYAYYKYHIKQLHPIMERPVKSLKETGFWNVAKCCCILCQQATNREGDLKAKTGWKAWEDPAPVSAIPIPTVT